tara:strand:+ start:619 stop:867 length:249 start_codon:yes stop_codon:yes gene_type:complete
MIERTKNLFRGDLLREREEIFRTLAEAGLTVSFPQEKIDFLIDAMVRDLDQIEKEEGVRPTVSIEARDGTIYGANEKEMWPT